MDYTIVWLCADCTLFLASEAPDPVFPLDNTCHACAHLGIDCEHDEWATKPFDTRPCARCGTMVAGERWRHGYMPDGPDVKRGRDIEVGDVIILDLLPKYIGKIETNHLLVGRRRLLANAQFVEVDLLHVHDLSHSGTGFLPLDNRYRVDYGSPLPHRPCCANARWSLDVWNRAEDTDSFVDLLPIGRACDEHAQEVTDNLTASGYVVKIRDGEAR